MKLSVLLMLAAGLTAGSAAAKEQIDANKTIKLPVYDSQGNKTGTRKVKAKDLWQEVDSWQDKTYRQYQSFNAGTLMTAQPTVFSNGERHESWSVPQEPNQQLTLNKQAEPIFTTMPVDTGLNPVFGPTPNTPSFLRKSMNNNFGSNGTFSVQQYANFNTSGDLNGVNYSDNFDVNGYVFGGRIGLLSKTTTKRSTKNSKTTKTDIKAMGTTFYVTQNGTVNANPSISRSIRKTKVFFVGVPVSVGGRVSGSMGANINYNLGNLSISGGINPYVNTGGRVDAGIDLLFVKAGVRGSLTFINARINSGFSATLNLANRLLTGNLNVSQSHDLLSGTVSVFAKIFYLFGSKTFTHDIFSWNGIRGNSTLINKRIYTNL